MAKLPIIDLDNKYADHNPDLEAIQLAQRDFNQEAYNELVKKTKAHQELKRDIKTLTNSLTEARDVVTEAHQKLSRLADQILEELHQFP